MFIKLTKEQKSIGILILLIVILITIIKTLPVAGKTLENNDQTLDVTLNGPSCRFGIAAFGNTQGAKLADFDAGWYLDFTIDPISSVPSNIEFFPMIHLGQVKDGDNYLDDYTVLPPLTDSGLGARIDANLGATWIVGNEPDRGPSPGSSPQDDLMPEMYARAFHDVYEYIKARDPSARVATAGLVEVTPGRIRYLDRVSDAYNNAYKMAVPADIWTMHLYVMPEVRPDYTPNGIASVAVGTSPFLGMRESRGQAEAHLCGNVNNGVYCFADHDNVAFFERQIRDMRIWMKEHGQQNKPLLITEYSILYNYEAFPDGSCDFLRDEFGQCFTPTRISNYLRSTFDRVDGVGEIKDTNIGLPQDNYRLVQQILWYSLFTKHVGNASNLYKDQALTELSAVGTAYQAEMAERTSVPNLLPQNAINGAGFIVTPATTATVTLSVDIFNNGDSSVASPVNVTFYANAAMTEIIDSVTLPGIEGCARGPVSVSVEWSGLTSGVHKYWVKVDSDNILTEDSESDNTASGIVIINPKQIFLPTITK